MSPPLRFERSVAARALEPGQVVVLDGRVVEVGPAPEGAGRVRIVIVTALGTPPGDRPDPREIVLTCESGQSFSTARRIGPDEPLQGPGLTFEDYGLALEDTVGVEGLDAGRIIVLDGEVVTCEPDAPGSVRLLIRIGRSRRELIVVCPADMETAAPPGEESSAACGSTRRSTQDGLRLAKWSWWMDASLRAAPILRTLARCGLYSSRRLVRPRATIPISVNWCSLARGT